MAKLLALAPCTSVVIKSVFVRTYQRRRHGKVETVRYHFRRPPLRPTLH
jgi:hypothetical protein